MSKEVIERKLEVIKREIFREEMAETSAKVRLKELKKQQMELLDRLDTEQVEGPKPSVESIRISRIIEGVNT